MSYVDLCPCCGFKPSRSAPFSVNAELQTVSHRGNTVKVSAQEARFVEGLQRTWPLPIAYERHMVFIWPSQTDADETNVMKVLACRLKRKLAPIGLTISTSWGVGFVIETLPESIAA